MEVKPIVPDNSEETHRRDIEVLYDQLPGSGLCKLKLTPEEWKKIADGESL